MHSERKAKPDAEPPAPLPEVQAYRTSAEDQRLGLSLLLSNRADRSDPAVESFMQFARTNSLDLTELWVGEVDGSPRLAALLIPGEGRTGTLLLSPIDRKRETPFLAAMVQQMVCELNPKHLRLVQALLEPHQRLQSESLKLAGFQTLATLAYLQRTGLTDASDKAVTPDQRMQLHTYSDQTRPIFEQAILTSYEDTLDCPGLLGLREIDDVLAGHKASGVFDPSLWFAWTHEDRPAAVMLLNTLSGRQAMELVYLGIAPAYRQRGLGRRLLAYGLAQAAARDVTSMLVAVDEQNTPAVRLYRQMDFAVTGRKIAMIQPLPGE